MEYKSLGRTDVKVSPLCLGTMNFGSRPPEDEAICMINQAIEIGLNLIDTANRYVDANEEIIGKALSLNGKRNRIVLATKVFFPMDPGNTVSRSRLPTEVQKKSSALRMQSGRKFAAPNQELCYGKMPRA